MENLRSCAYSHKKDKKSNLFRVCKTKSGEVVIDLDYRVKGRGAYLSKDISIIELAKAKNSLSRVLRCNVSKDIYDRLLALLKED